MAGPNVQATFATGGASITAQQSDGSDAVQVPTGTTTMRVTISGLDASNTVRTQRRTTPGGTWVNQTLYSANQSGSAVTVVAGEEWRLVQVTQQATRDILYKLSCES